jgi:hypothetical protein
LIIDMLRNQLSIFSLAFCLIVSGAMASPIDSAGADKVGHPAIDSYQAMEMNSHSAKMLLEEGEQAWRAGDLDVALHAVKRSLQLDNDDIDAHCLYAHVLEEQLDSQSDKDPSLFNKCVQEWLDIMRNKYGEEKHMRIHGINPFGDLYHDDERSIAAKTELRRLTGFVPKTFETDHHYLTRVLLPVKTTVAGTVVEKK